MKRSEQKINDTWDLSGLYANAEDWEKSYKEILTSLDSLSEVEGTLGESADALYKALNIFKENALALETLSSWAFLNFEADALSPENQRRAGLADALYAKFSQNSSFFEPEILEIDSEKLNEYLKEERFAEYRVFLNKILHMKSHTLSRREEHLLSLNAEAGSAASNAFHDLNDVDMKFEDVRGEKLTHASFASFIRNEDETIREEAYRKYYKSFEEHQHVIARLYAGSVAQDIFLARARNYKSSLEAALYQDDVPESVYRNLISTVHEYFPLLHRYYALMAKVLKKDKLKHYDVYVPLVKGIDSHHTYEEAVAIIKEAVAPLGKEYQDTLVKGLTTKRRVDRYENEGKRSGAFSAGGYVGNPYILTSFKEDVLNSVFTLIHEGGHSMHSYYSVRNNPFMSYNYTIFEAEVASTFNEELLGHYLLAHTEDKAMRAYLIGTKLADIVATLFRQTMFAEFELLVHEEVEKGGVATVDFLRKTYRSLLEAYFGPQMEFEEQSDLEGLRIPHFYRAFYVYKYATGISAAIALSQKVLSGGEKEREDYLSFLKSGGSKYPIDALKLAGVDMAKPEAIRSALEYFGTLLKEAEELI